MSYNWNTRTELLLGADRMERLAHSHVLVVGLGGVGAYAAEQICRAGIGHMTIVDADTVNESNINRQLPALHSTLGMPKAEVVARRLLDINPRLKLGVLNEFLRDERTEEVLSATRYDFVVDAIDSLSPKVFLLYHAYQRNIPVVSSMGAGAVEGDLIERNGENLVVPEGGFYVLGDNGQCSYDSRYWKHPFVMSDDIVAKVILPTR